MRRRLDLPPAVVAPLDLLQANDVGILRSEKMPHAIDVYTGIVGIIAIPRLAVLDIECEEPKHSGA